MIVIGTAPASRPSIGIRFRSPADPPPTPTLGPHQVTPTPTKVPCFDIRFFLLQNIVALCNTQA